MKRAIPPAAHTHQQEREAMDSREGERLDCRKRWDRGLVGDCGRHGRGLARHGWVGDCGVARHGWGLED